MKNLVNGESLRQRFACGLSFKGLLVISSALILWAIAFWPGITNALHMWYSDTTFNHCFFVIPAALYFGCKDWHLLDCNNQKYDFLAVVAIIALIILWSFGYAANIQLFVHVATFLILPVLIWFCIGRSNALKLWFPLTFPVFAVPFGSELIAPFQTITADIAVYLLNLSGIPTFQSGLYIDVPNGKFEVAEACAGVRFFVASLCFGYFYAYVSYQKLYKRILFVIFSALFPILANGLRVFGTIVIGEKIGMQYAAGADHLIYGWAFFAVVLLLLIWVGSYWQDTSPKASQKDEYPSRRIAVPSLVLLPLLAIILWKAVIDQASPAPFISIDNTAVALRQIDSRANWKPQFFGAAETLHGRIINTDLDLFIAAYSVDSEESELISFNNRFYSQDVWTIAKEKTVTLTHAENTISAKLLDLRSASGQHRAVVYWYKLPGYSGASVLQVKLRQALGKLTGVQYPASVIVLSSLYQRNIDAGMGQLINDIGDLLPDVENMMKGFD